jgi:hypothetical protein
MLGAGRGGVIRDTGGGLPDCYHWTVTVFGDTDPVASGRAEQPADARSRAEERLSPMRKAAGSRSGSGLID